LNSGPWSSFDGRSSPSDIFFVFQRHPTERSPDPLEISLPSENKGGEDKPF